MTTPRYSQAGVQALKHGVAAFRAGDRIVPARQAFNLLAAVDDLPPAHDCPGLAECFGHPRWHVVRIGKGWDVYPPNSEPSAVPWYAFPTHAEAVAYATERARADQLAAIQDGAR